MKEALVIHPVMSYYAGAEYLCLNVCQALQEIGYRVSLACDVFSPPDIERIFGLGRIMEKCDYVRIPDFRARFRRFLAVQKVAYARRVLPMFSEFDAGIIFSTQSSPFIIPRRTFHFVYNAADLFSYPPAAAPLKIWQSDKSPRNLYHKVLMKFVRTKASATEDWFFAIGSGVLRDLKTNGYPNSSLAFPPCRVDFKPRIPKRKQVVQAARMIPDKRLDLFLEIASRIPEYHFYLIGKDAPWMQRLYPGYSKRILSILPKNVTYVDASVRERPELFEESKVYLYTGTERGIGLALVEAMAAGCVPFSPPNVGMADVIEASGVGVIYGSVEEAEEELRAALELEPFEAQAREISERAKLFSPDVFRRWIGRIAQSGRAVPSIDSQIFQPGRIS